MLEEIEDGRIPEADFIELNACTQGCVGGCFTVENPYTTKMRLQDLMNTLPVSRNCFLAQGAERNILKFRRRPQFLPAFLLDADRGVAMEKQLQIPGPGIPSARPSLRLLRSSLLPCVC